MSFVNVKRVLASSLVMAAGAGCGSVEEGVEPPVNEKNAGTVEEAGTLGLTGTLVTSDSDSSAEKLVYTVATLPANGALMNDGTALAVGGTFTQKDVNDGKISYVNDGAEKTADAFTWTLSDGPNTIGPLEFGITITAVNDKPNVVANTTTDLAEGGNAVLSMDQLTVSDAEMPDPSSLTFTILSIAHGSMEQKVGSGPFNAIAVGATFTEQNVIDGDIKFIDSGVDDAKLSIGQATTASFSWRVADADGATTEGTTSFNVTPVDDPAVMTWKASTCYTPNVAKPANPVMSLVDPDDQASAYQICVASFVNGTQVVCPTGTTVNCVTNSVQPTLKNGSTVLAVNACVAANALTGLTLTNTTTDYGGGVYWQLKKGGVSVGSAAGVSTGSCP